MKIFLPYFVPIRFDIVVDDDCDRYFHLSHLFLNFNNCTVRFPCSFSPFYMLMNCLQVKQDDLSLWFSFVVHLNVSFFSKKKISNHNIFILWDERGKIYEMYAWTVIYQEVILFYFFILPLFLIPLNVIQSNHHYVMMLYRNGNICHECENWNVIIIKNCPKKHYYYIHMNNTFQSEGKKYLAQWKRKICTKCIGYSGINKIFKWWSDMIGFFHCDFNI